MIARKIAKEILDSKKMTIGMTADGGERDDDVYLKQMISVKGQIINISAFVGHTGCLNYSALPLY